MLSPLLLVLVVVVMVVVSVGASCPVPGLECSDADIAVKAGDATVSIISKQAVTDNLSGNMHVRPGASFEGITVLVQESQGKYGVWFPLPNHCFPDRSLWWEINVGVMAQKHSFDTVFVVRLNGCSKSCSMKTSELGFFNLEVMAHGPSSWRMTPPSTSCPKMKTLAKDRITIVNCQAPPSTRIPEMCPTVSEESTPLQPKHPTPPTTSARSPKNPKSSDELLLPVSIVVVIVVVILVVLPVVVVLAVLVGVKIRSLPQQTQAPAAAVNRLVPPSRPAVPPPVKAPGPPRGEPRAVPRGWPITLPRSPPPALPRQHQQSAGPDEDALYDTFYEIPNNLYDEVL